jgi:hypothetical protein
MHAGPNAVALTVSVYGAFGCGRRKRAGRQYCTRGALTTYTGGRRAAAGHARRLSERDAEELVNCAGRRDRSGEGTIVKLDGR